MKLHLKKGVRVKARNILGKPVEVEEWYYIYKWTLRGRRYLSLYMPNPAGVVFSDLCKAHLPAKITYRWYNGPADRYTIEEAKFFIQDIENNPHRYINYD